MATTTTKVTISLPWWAFHYVRACVVFGLVFGMTPDEDKILRRIARHVKCKVVSDA